MLIMKRTSVAALGDVAPQQTLPDVVLTVDRTTMPNHGTLGMTVTVSGSHGTPTGHVSFQEGGGELGDGNLVGGVSHQINEINDGPGPRTMRARYDGDSTYGLRYSHPVVVTLT